MRLTINSNMDLKAAGETDLAVVRAAVQIYIARGHNLPDFQIPASFAYRDCKTIAEIGDHLVGKAGDKNADMSFDVHEPLSDQGINSPDLAAAMAMIYAWREYRWTEFEDAVTDNECVADAVDYKAQKYDLSECDSISKRSSDDKGFIAPTEEHTYRF